MFQFFRRRDTAVRVFLGALLVLVCVMLVVTLIPGLTGSAPSEELVLASVAGEKITGQEVSRRLQVMSRNNRLPANLIPLYMPQVVNQLLMQKVILAEAHRLGLMVSTEELAAELRLNPQFFSGGSFIGREQYQSLIESRFGMTVPQFEEEYRESLLSDKLRRVVTAGVTVSDQEVEREFHRRNDKLRIEYALLKTSDLKDTLSISEAEIADFFQKNRGRYQVPERRRFKLLFVDTARLKESAAVSEQDLQRYYNENKDRYRVQERVKVSHILLKTVGKTPPESEPVLKKAQEVLARLRRGEEFALLAKVYSEDAATTPKGGDLGWIVRGQTVPEFEKAAFSLEPGALSEVIKTQYGFHILKVHERQRAHLQTLEEVREPVLSQVKQEKAQQAADEMSRKAENAVKKNPGNLQAVAAQLGLEVIETAFLKRGEPLPHAGTSSSLEDALFSGTLKPNEMTPVLTTPNGLVIASLGQVSPEHQAELAEVRSPVETDLRQEKAAQLAVSRMKELAERVRKEGDLKKASAAQKLDVKASDPLTREGSIPDVGAVSSLGEGAFSMAVGEIGGPVSATDGQLVFRILERQPASREELAGSRDALRRELLENKRGTFFRLFTDNVRARLEREGKLKVNQAAIDRLSKSFQ